MIISKKPQYSFDDISLIPQPSDINSRQEVSLSQDFLGVELKVPILSAAMDTVTGSSMAIAMHQAGGLGILHRFTSYEDRKKDIITVSESNVPVILSIGVNDPDGPTILNYFDHFYSLPVLPMINIDVAHGDHTRVISLIEFLKKNRPGIKVLAGNVSTRSGYYRLADAGADAVKVGIGSGSVCRTRTVTGHGIPLLASLLECIEARRDCPNSRMIADGGMRSSGDIVKALAAGADAVILGNLLAGTNEALGSSEGNYKTYRGQSIVGSNASTYAPEGISKFVAKKGPVAETLKLLAGGIRSGLSYSGARTLEEFRIFAEGIVVTDKLMNSSVDEDEIYSKV